jgi:hypothetical protein
MNSNSLAAQREVSQDVELCLLARWQRHLPMLSREAADLPLDKSPQPGLKEMFKRTAPKA